MNLEDLQSSLILFLSLSPSFFPPSLSFPPSFLLSFSLFLSFHEQHFAAPHRGMHREESEMSFIYWTTTAIGRVQKKVWKGKADVWQFLRSYVWKNDGTDWKMKTEVSQKTGLSQCLACWVLTTPMSSQSTGPQVDQPDSESVPGPQLCPWAAKPLARLPWEAALLRK